MLIVAALLLVLALVVAGVGAVAIVERLPRNRWAGVRTADTMADEASFRLANKVAAPTMLAAGALLAIGGFAAALLGGPLGLVAAAAGLLAALVTAGFGAALGSRAAAAVAESAGGCGAACGACSLKGACGTAWSTAH